MANKNFVYKVMTFFVALLAISCNSASSKFPTPSLIEVQEIPVAFQGTWTLESADSNPFPAEYKKLVFKLTPSSSDGRLLAIEKDGKLREIGYVLATSFLGNDLDILFKSEIAMSISLDIHEIAGRVEGTFTHGLSGTDAYKGKVLFIPYTP